MKSKLAAVLVSTVALTGCSGQAIKDFMAEKGYPPIRVPHAFFTRNGGFEADLTAAGQLVEPWLPIVAAQHSEEVPLADLWIGLQCGGSDG